MAEENKSIRLNKAMREFNVGLQNLVDFLTRKGFQIDANPNTRLTAEQYTLLAEEFKGEREVKKQADRVEIASSNDNVVISANKKINIDEDEVSDNEVIIKNVFVNTSFDKARTTSDKEAPVEKDSLSEPASTHLESAENQASDVVDEPIDNVTEPAVISNEGPVIEPVNVDTQGGNLSLNVIGKIDLNGINTKTRPDRLPRSKDKDHGRRNGNGGNNQRNQEHRQPVSTPVETPALPKKDKEKDKEKDKVVEFIPTEYTKLEGPKTVGKVDLSQFDKPKPVEGEKKKRKHIKKEVIKVDESSHGTNAKGGNANGSQKNNGGKKNKSKAAPKKPEIADAEVEKQIRDTLARLGTIGKSKTSKHNREKRQKVHMRIEEEQLNMLEEQKTLRVTEFVTANELATMMNIPVTQVISTCMSVGIFVSINQRLDAETIKFIADEFNFSVVFASADILDTINNAEEPDKPEDLVPRSPIITVMGHVDHGKTSLLDYIRKTNVIAGEAGGITQHIGAYEVTMSDGRKITFLDTPGHEAFTAMRARGAQVTDIAIIVISADDKIMPQTVEAINHAQAAGVPIVFAINKIDKPGADPDRIKTELANMNLLVEEWGGKYQSQDISAKKGLNVEELLEKVLLQADIMELKGNPNKRAKGTVLESSLDKGRGYVAKILVADGSIRKGDPILAGAISGRVRTMYNERNQEVLVAGPSQPVLLLGLNGACQAGDTFNVMESEKEAKDFAAKRTQLAREQGLRTQTHVTLDEIGRRIALGNFKELNIIVKGDVDGSVEALSGSLLKLSTEEVQVNVIHKAVGQITESDVLLAESSDAIIIGFQVRPSVGARKMAETQQIDIRLYSIIYDAINELKDAIEGMLAPETQEKIVANLEIRETFKISKVGTIAGCMCLDGKITRSHSIRIIRDGIVVFTGKLASLKRFKDDVKEVLSGQDCGLNIENFNDIKVGDIVEAYEVIEIKRKL